MVRIMPATVISCECAYLLHETDKPAAPVLSARRHNRMILVAVPIPKYYLLCSGDIEPVPNRHMRKPMQIPREMICNEKNEINCMSVLVILAVD